MEKNGVMEWFFEAIDENCISRKRKLKNNLVIKLISQAKCSVTTKKMWFMAKMLDSDQLECDCSNYNLNYCLGSKTLLLRHRNFSVLSHSKRREHDMQPSLGKLLIGSFNAHWSAFIRSLATWCDNL